MIVFESAAVKLVADARALAATIWREETGADVPADTLDRIISRATQAGRLSLRRVVQNIVPLLKGKP